jgi:hypothetical protein
VTNDVITWAGDVQVPATSMAAGLSVVSCG